MNHQKLAIPVDLTVTAAKVGSQPCKVESPDPSKLGKVDSVVEVFDEVIAGVEVFQPIGEGVMVIDAIEIPTLDCLKILVMSWHLVEAPIATMRENVFVGKDTGNVIGQANGDDMEKESTPRLQAGGYPLEGIRQVPHMAKDADRKDLVELLVELHFVKIPLDQSKPPRAKIAFRILHFFAHLFALFMT
jgi:hypothetical protein